MKNLILAAMMILSLPAFAAEGGTSVRGGANSVGDKLYDDYEQEGVRQLTSKQVYAIVKPLFQRLDKKLFSVNHIFGPDTYNEYGPSGSEDFLELLSYGLDGIKWYLDPKPLDQKNHCQNQSVLAVQKVVRACQSDISVRIDRAFFEGNPDVQQALVLHELLTWIKLHAYNNDSITDESLRDASRALRNPNISNEELVETLKRDGFGSYSPEPTAKQKKEAALATQRFNAACAKDPQYSCSCPGFQKTGVFIWGLGVVGQSEKEKGFGCP